MLLYHPPGLLRRLAADRHVTDRDALKDPAGVGPVVGCHQHGHNGADDEDDDENPATGTAALASLRTRVREAA
jgi:hypothetical protein